MIKLPIALAALTMATSAHAQYYAAATPSRGGGSTVAYNQSLYYIQRLQPNRYYPPNRYGYIEGRPYGYQPNPVGGRR